VYFKGYEEVTLYKGKGCEQCGGTGYRGRVGLYELLEITPGVAEAIAGNKNTAEILSVARQEGMQTMFEDGLEKALTGTTTIEELLRSTSPPDDVITQAQAEGSIS
jgi:type IV pilus assembly protein PilB